MNDLDYFLICACKKCGERINVSVSASAIRQCRRIIQCDPCSRAEIMDRIEREVGRAELALALWYFSYLGALLILAISIALGAPQ